MLAFAGCKMCCIALISNVVWPAWIGFVGDKACDPSWIGFLDSGAELTVAATAW
jgi:hypothetical protein